MVVKRLIEDNANVWDQYINHQFVKKIQDGSLGAENFKFYMKQDLMFLNQYSKCYSLLSMQARNQKELNHALSTQKTIVEVESQLHKSILGADSEKLGVKEESLANLAYTRFVQSTAIEGDFLDTLSALAPCAFGYVHIGRKMAYEFGALEKLDFYTRAQKVDMQKMQNALKNHTYADWILTYSSDEFFEYSLDYAQLFDSVKDEISEAKFKRLSEIFYTATRLEVNFWQHALEMKMDL